MGKVTLFVLKIVIVPIVSVAPAQVPAHSVPSGGVRSFCYSERSL